MTVDQLIEEMRTAIEYRIERAVAAERERCAEIAEHLNGWGNKATQQSGLAEHIARVIRNSQ